MADEGIRIDALNDALVALADMQIPVMRNNQTFRVAVQEVLDLVIAGAPGSLNTLDELAAALGDDPTFSATIAAALLSKLPKAGGTMTGDIDMAGHNIININEGTPDFLSGLDTIRASTTTITVNPGWIKGKGLYVKNTAGLTKSLSTAWSAGPGGGALDTGAFAASSTYFLHALRKISDGSFEFLSSLSPTAPTVPGGFQHVGRIWINLVNASSQILDYTQSGNKCILAAAISEGSIAVSFSKALITLSGAPAGISVDMILDMVVVAAAQINASADAKLYDGYLPSGTNAYSAHGTSSSATAANSVSTAGTELVRTNTARQIYQAVAYTVGNGNTILSSQGWRDWQLPRVGT